MRTTGASGIHEIEIAGIDVRGLMRFDSSVASQRTVTRFRSGVGGGPLDVVSLRTSAASS